MKTQAKHALSAACLTVLFSAVVALAASDHAGHSGRLIHESTVQGFRLSYHLLELSGRSERHLIVYIQAPDGQPVGEATVGYLVKGPEGAVQKEMAMQMEKSFGADLNLSRPGRYQIKVKAVVGDKKLLDDFSYQSTGD